MSIRSLGTLALDYLTEILRWVTAAILGLFLYLLAEDVIYLFVNIERWRDGLMALLPITIVVAVYKVILNIKSLFTLSVLLAFTYSGLHFENKYSPLSKQ